MELPCSLGGLGDISTCQNHAEDTERSALLVYVSVLEVAYAEICAKVSDQKKKPLGNKHLAIIYKIQLLQLLFSVFRYYGSCVICEEVSSLFAWKKVLKELCSAHEQRT